MEERGFKGGKLYTGLRVFGGGFPDAWRAFIDGASHSGLVVRMVVYYDQPSPFNPPPAWNYDIEVGELTRCKRIVGSSDSAVIAEAVNAALELVNTNGRVA